MNLPAYNGKYLFDRGGGDKKFPNQICFWLSDGDSLHAMKSICLTSLVSLVINTRSMATWDIGWFLQNLL